MLCCNINSYIKSKLTVYIMRSTLPHYIYSSTVLCVKYNNSGIWVAVIPFYALYTLWGWNVFKINHTFTSYNIKVMLTHECISDYDPIIILKALFWIHALFISCMHTNKAVNILTLWFHAILCYSSDRQLVAVMDQKKGEPCQQRQWRRRLTANKRGCTK